MVFDKNTISDYGITLNDINPIEFNHDILRSRIISKLNFRSENWLISIIGRVSTGKSSFINRLLQFELLPSSSGQTTLYSIFIKFTDTDKYNVVIEYNINSEESSSISLDNLDELKEYLCKEKDSIDIKRMQIELPKINYPDLLHKCVLIDHPAIGYSKELNEYVLQQCYQSHVFVLLANAVKTIKESEYEFLSMLSEKRNVLTIKFVITFMDSVENKFKVQDHYKTRINEIWEKSEKILLLDYRFISNKNDDICGKMGITLEYNGEQWVKEITSFLSEIPNEDDISKAINKFIFNLKKRRDAIENIIKQYLTYSRFNNYENVLEKSTVNLFEEFVKLPSNINEENIEGGKYETYIQQIIYNMGKINERSTDEFTEKFMQKYKEFHMIKELVDSCGIYINEWNIRYFLFFTELCVIALYEDYQYQDISIMNNSFEYFIRNLDVSKWINQNVYINELRFDEIYQQLRSEINNKRLQELIINLETFSPSDEQSDLQINCLVNNMLMIFIYKKVKLFQTSENLSEKGVLKFLKNRIISKCSLGWKCVAQFLKNSKIALYSCGWKCVPQFFKKPIIALCSCGWKGVLQFLKKPIIALCSCGLLAIFIYGLIALCSYGWKCVPQFLKMPIQKLSKFIWKRIYS